MRSPEFDRFNAMEQGRAGEAPLPLLASERVRRTTPVDSMLARQNRKLLARHAQKVDPAAFAQYMQPKVSELDRGLEGLRQPQYSNWYGEVEGFGPDLEALAAGMLSLPELLRKENTGAVPNPDGTIKWMWEGERVEIPTPWPLEPYQHN